MIRKISNITCAALVGMTIAVSANTDVLPENNIQDFGEKNISKMHSSEKRIAL